MVAAALPGASGAQSQDAGIADSVTLPDGIVWVTNNDDPLIGSPDAIRGGTFNYLIAQYPLTFRLMGPNSANAFAAWNRAFTMAFGLVGRHPVTDNFIPLMATHWSRAGGSEDHLFPIGSRRAFSDGEPVTADDYVFTWRMLQSEHIVDPFYNIYAEQYYESVDKIDDYTLRIVGTRPSWRPLPDYAGIWPTPSHAVVLDEDWVSRTTNEYQIAVGPYVVSDVARGEFVTFERLDDWWGDGKRYFIGAVQLRPDQPPRHSNRAVARLSPPWRAGPRHREHSQNLERGVHLRGGPQRLDPTGEGVPRHALRRLRAPYEPRGPDLPEQGLPEGDAVPVQLRATQ